jgi:hypothetical protein
MSSEIQMNPIVCLGLASIYLRIVELGRNDERSLAIKIIGEAG